MNFNKIFKSKEKFCSDFILDIPNPNEPTEATLALNKAWVQSLVQSTKGRDYIYKNLLGVIIKVLDYSRPFCTEDIPSNKVKEAFEFIITTYPAASVWLATYKVLGWCNLEKSDYVMYRYIENTVRQALKEKQSFKDNLSEKADEFERNADIKEHVRIIKLKMDEHARERHFTITLVESKPGHTITLGAGRGPEYQTFIPKQVEPWVYMKLFTEALKELGFEDKDIEKGAGEEDYCYYYRLKVRW